MHNQRMNSKVINDRQEPWLTAFLDDEQLPTAAATGIALHFGRVADWLLEGCYQRRVAAPRGNDVGEDKGAPESCKAAPVIRSSRSEADHFVSSGEKKTGIRRDNRGPIVVGINGAQGSGKSTLARYLQRALAQQGLRVALVSLDDFYLTQRARRQLARDVHPLLAVRGVPGTHDVTALRRCLEQLRAAAAGASVSWPVFDKAADDRADKWQTFAGIADVIVLEGWCVGTPAESEAQLEIPLNELEAVADADGRWRHYANEKLRTDYAPLFELLDCLCFLRIPDFSLVQRWRGVQEQKLQARSGGGMTADEIAAFILYFERLTRAALRELPALADCLLEFDERQRCVASKFR